MDLFEVGLLQCKTQPYLAVSPDAVVVLSNGNNLTYACVEMKTRVSEDAQQKALVNVQTYGRIVDCTYDGAIFQCCVPSEHRGQLLHQAYVCGFRFGVYIVSIVNGEEGGTIAQIVYFAISHESISEHGYHLMRIVQPLLGWIFERSVIQRGYLRSEDFPSLPLRSQVIATLILS